MDFIVDVEGGRDPIILQISDIQIIDAAQKRTPDRIGDYACAYWATDKMEDRCFKYVRETVDAVKPDLILMAGDNVYGEFDDAGTSWLAFVEFMDSFGIPWAPIMGNHDTESKKGADWQCEQLVNAKYCLFKQRELNGNGNYSVGIRQNGKVTRVFFMMDTGSVSASAETLANGHTKHVIGLLDDQLAWYTESMARIRAAYPDVKHSLMTHVQPHVFRVAAGEYGLDEANSKVPFETVFIDRLENKAEGDYGIINHHFVGHWDQIRNTWNLLKEQGADSFFVGHEHAVSACMTYEGIKMVFGQKSSTYDGVNYLASSGQYIFSHDRQGIPQVGGTVISLSEDDGSLLAISAYLCKEE